MPQDASEKPAKATVLIVEDDEFLRDLVVKNLQESGYAAMVAKDGESALAGIANRKPDLILLDLILPAMSGLELMAKLKEDEATKDIPFIVLSNSAETQSKEDSVAAGAMGYLVKAQVTPVEIVAAVDEFFTNHPLSR